MPSYEADNQHRGKEDSPDKLREVFELDWAYPPSASDLAEEVTEALNDASYHHSRIKHWLSVRDAKRISHEDGKSGLQPKLIRKQSEWRYASLSEPYLATDDIFNCLAVTAEDVVAAKHNKLILNDQFNNDINKVALIDAMVRTLTDEGTVFLKAGWEFQQEEWETVDSEQAEDGTTIFTSEPYTTMRTVKNHPTAEVCHYASVIPDPTCQGNLDKANFVAYRYQTSIKDLKASGLYRNLENINTDVDNTLLDITYHTEPQFKFKDRARKRITVTEYWGVWDVHGTGSVEPILACFVGGVMIRLEYNPFPDGKPPFIAIPYLPVANSLYGEPDAELTEDNQIVMGATLRGIIDLMAKSANSQTGIRKGFLDPLNARRYQDGDDYEFNPVSHPEQAIYAHKFPTIPESALTLINTMNVDAESLTGVKAYHGGIGGESLGRTATGARGALDAASKRELGILRRISNGITQLGYKFMSMNSVFLSEEEVVRVTEEEFVSITRDSLNGSVDIKLTISTAEADNDRAEHLGFMLQTTGPVMPLPMTQLILAEIATLRKMPQLASMIQEYAPEPDPIAQAKGELELQLLQAQIAYTQARAVEHGAGAELRGAKVNVEAARARSLGGKADIDDLKFMEGVDRTKHKEKIAEQDNDLRNQLDKATGEAMLSGMRNPQ